MIPFDEWWPEVDYPPVKSPHDYKPRPGMKAAPYVREAAAWARRIRLVNGRFAEINLDTGEIMSEPMGMTRFLAADPDADLPLEPGDSRYPRPLRNDRYEWRDGAWYKDGKRVFTLNEKREALQLAERTSIRKAATELGISPNTIKTWLFRGRFHSLAA